LAIEEVAALGVMGTRRRGGEPLSLGSSQPKPRAWRRKHIADGPKGAASRLPARRAIQLGEARARQKFTLHVFARCRADRESGRDIVLACPIFAAKPPLYPADGGCAA